MPYEVVKRGSRWAVQKQDGSKTFGTHSTKEKAEAQMAALYASEPRGAQMAEDVRYLHLLGATTAPRVETFDGREHLVVPVTALIGDNVIHAVNAPHAEFVPASILSAQGWDGRPLVLGHPVKDGHQVSANDPAVLERQGFGFMSGTRVVDGRKLVTEAWMDVAKLERLGQHKMLADARAGKPIEVSVGSYVQTRGRAGEHAGKSYKAEWAAMASDHLAFLPESVGACSVEMGCGANRAAMRVCGDRMEDEASKSIIDPSTLKCLRDIPQSERDEMKESDFAGPDETFPIKTQADVDAAKHLIGKAADPEAVKRKVIAIAKRKGLSIPDAWKTRAARAAERLKALVAPLLRALDEEAGEPSEEDDPDEEAESISYESMRDLIAQAEASLAAGRKHVEALIDDNGEGDDEEVEEAHLEALVAMCVQLYGTANGLVKLASACLRPDEATSPMAYMQARMAAGARHNKDDQKIIQDTHDKMVELGATCAGARAAEAAVAGIVDGDDQIEAAAGGVQFRAACGCKGEIDMKRSESVQKILTAAATEAKKPLAEFQKTDGFTEEQVKGLNMVPERILEHLATLAAKSPADALIQAKHNADVAIAAHGHAMNVADEAEKAKAAVKAKKDAEKKAGTADEEDETDEEKSTEKKMKAAQAAGFKTVAEHEEAQFLETHPSLKTLVDRQKKHEADRRESLIATLKTCGALSEEQLKAKSLCQLEELAAFAKVEVPDFSGRGMPEARGAEASDVYLNPPNPYSEENLKKVREARAS